MYRKDQFLPFESNTGATSIYFQLNPSLYSGDVLKIASARPFSVFRDGTLLVGGQKEVSIVMDSLSQQAFGTQVRLAVYQPRGIAADLSTVMYSPLLGPNRLESGPLLRASDHYRDFMVISFFVLVVWLVMVGFINPKLTADYFSVTGLISLRETDDKQLNLRIGNSANLLFYLFVSFLLAFYLMLVVQLPEASLPFGEGSRDFRSLAVHWVLLAAIVALILLIKLILTLMFATLFNISDQASFQFFNFIRSLLLGVGFFSVVGGILLLVLGGNETVATVLSSLFTYGTIGWCILGFIKLRARVTCSAFHLFSYICATEIIPLLIILKVLYE
jgi:hypothetical protein